MFSLFADSLLTNYFFPDIVAPERIIVKGVLKAIDSDRQGFDFFLLSWLTSLLQYFHCRTF